MHQLCETDRGRNARRLSPEERSLVCERIRRELALEYLSRTNSKREAWARIAIGLPPVPRPTVNRERRQ